MSDKLKWSNFQTRVVLPNRSILLKSTLTGAVVSVDCHAETAVASWIDGKQEIAPPIVGTLTNPDVGLLVPAERDEYSAWRDKLLDRRNNAAHTFTLHFLPTTLCQLECSYCFENGSQRMRGMRPELVGVSREWLATYLADHPEIDTFRLALFGGEPLLRKDIIKLGLEAFHSLARERGLDFWTELTSNAELLNEATAKMLSQHEWRRVQITLDGPKDVHDARRHGRNMRPTFERIMRNVQMLLSTDYIPKVDIRISFDLSNADRVPELIRYLAGLDKQYRINLSLGLITPTLQNRDSARDEALLAEKALVVWNLAKQHGFEIPEEFITGPWCVAIAKHSAVLQPDGTLQKCFCTVGREEYNFGTIHEQPKGGYLYDSRFEHFRRTDQCIEEKCQYLPMCGGGCIHDAIVAAGGADGSRNRFCQKTLLTEMNKGLLVLNHAS